MTSSKKLILADFLPYRLSVLSNTISRAISETYSDKFNISIWQWRVMAVLGEQDHLTAKAICDKTAMDKVAVSRAVNSLASIGYIDRETVIGDARQTRLTLSAQGRGVYDEIAQSALSFESELLASFSPSEQLVFTELMTKLAKTVAPHKLLWPRETEGEGRE